MKFAPSSFFHLIIVDTGLDSFLSSLIEVDASICQIWTSSEEMLLAPSPIFCYN